MGRASIRIARSPFRDIHDFKAHFKLQKPTFTAVVRFMSAPFSQNAHSPTTLLKEAIPSLSRYAQF